MTVAYCLASLQYALGIQVGPEAVAWVKSQIAGGRSLLACRKPGGRETHFVTIHGRTVLAVWDAPTARVVTFLRRRTDPARLDAFVAGMRTHCKRTPPMLDTDYRRLCDAQAEHDRLVSEARASRGLWAATMVATWAGAYARDHGLSDACPFGSGEPVMAARWRAAYAKGRDTVIPTADIVPPSVWTPRTGTTHAARCAMDD